MTPTPELQEVLRNYSKEDFLALARNADLHPLGNRVNCPFPGCRDQAGERKRNAVIFASGRGDALYRVKCHRCSEGGTYLDFLMAVKGLSLQEAIAEVKGTAPAKPAVVRLAPKERPEEEGRLAPVEVQKVWDACAKSDHDGQEYLESRGLGVAVELGIVRFATGEHPDQGVSKTARRGYRIAVLCRDVIGDARGIQLRLVRQPKDAKEPKILSVRGSSTSRSFFGSPHLIENSELVCVTEGLADTLAVSGWAGKGVVVVGAAGKDGLHRLGEELIAAGVPLDGKTFALFAQNDKPTNVSRTAFMRLARILTDNGAQCVFVPTDSEWKDIAEWRQAQPELPWPPDAISRVEEGPGEEEGATGPTMVVPRGSALALQSRITTDSISKDFTTLCSLIDERVHRESIFGRDVELQLDEMSGCILAGGVPLSSGDYGAVRLGVERHTLALNGKRIKYGPNDVSEALITVASKRPWHPVREWLGMLTWDGVPRIKDVATALGVATDGLEAACLRKWFIGAVARPLRPGCKMDNVLILVGGQGVGKSTFFSVLGGAWFTDSPVDVHGKEGLLVMRRSWIVEWPELESMRRARDAEAIKAFVTQATDHYRAPYARQASDVPRSCVFVGTNNNLQVLNDPTGSRRFWVIRVGDDLNLDWVKDNREQLFAEAMSYHSAGETWWLDRDQDRELNKKNAAFQSYDVWADLVAQWLGNPDRSYRREFTTAEILAEAVAKPAGQWTRGDDMRIASVMSSLGWEQRRRWAEGVKGRFWVRTGTAKDPGEEG